MSEISSDQQLTRAEVADYLREFAAQLDTPETTRPDQAKTDDHRVTLLVGDDSATINPPELVSFEVDVATDDSLIGDEVEHEVGFEVSWKTEAADEGEEAGLDIV